MEQLRYIVEDSTIAEILGVQSFSTKETAILELVKNAYDAQAKKLCIAISPASIVLTDNGVGMDLDTIRTHWMHVGKSYKGYIENGRVLAGSKGVGRFALARLGKNVIIESRRTGSAAIIWSTDWTNSTVDEASTNIPIGTTINISGLREKWSEKSIAPLVDFLSRSYADKDMQIDVLFGGEVYTVSNYLTDFTVGRDYVWRIEMVYYCSSQKLDYKFTGDEFQESAQSYCAYDISSHKASLSINNELSTMQELGEPEDIQNGLTLLGDFSAVLFFQNKPSREDVEKFLYKQRSELSQKNSGIILYRNAFSTAGYEGRKDWLELGKRSRKSPAAASHPTGSWRVRENQMNGSVRIDKRTNKMLTDLANRQGMEENLYYNLFVNIIIAGISRFEDYRQSLIRAINKKNKPIEHTEDSPILKRVISNPKEISTLDLNEQQSLVKEIRAERKQTKEQQSTWAEAEERYKYDIRLLNILATLGLRSSSMAHEMNNDRSAIVTNCENIINALKIYGYWEDLSSPEKTRVQYRNIPALLRIAQKVEAKMVSFMDVMLSEIERDKFTPTENNVYSILNNIANRWELDYAKLKIELIGDEGTQFWIPEDIIIAIFDNLILNSVQQNDKRNIIMITIQFRVMGDKLWFSYADNGVGLIPKYQSDPNRILNVHETSRKKGHGLGMWIVNNSVIYTDGKIISIRGENGFYFEFILGKDE